VFDAAVKTLRAEGAVIVEIKGPDEATQQKLGELESEVLRTEFKAAIEAYLATTPAAVKTRTLADLIAFDAAEPRELALFGQDIFEDAAKKPALTDPAYRAKRAQARTLARATLDKMLADNRLDAIVAPGGGPSSLVDPVNGSAILGAPSSLPAVSSYPHLVVPSGYVSGLPVALSFVGPAWSEAKLLALGFAFEQATHARREPEFLPNVAARPEIARAYDPR
jgi:amidase